MAEISIPEEEFGEPTLTYWKPVPKPPPAALPLAPSYVGHGIDNMLWPYRVPTYKDPSPLPPTYIYQQPQYHLSGVMHSYIQNPQLGLSPGCLPVEGERRRMPQSSLLGPEHLLYTLSTNPNFEQDNQSMTDSMIQDEVTRAAKTLFSKRNRTLLHWLNPDVNKNQIKIDVDAAWESLPPTEKVFYISQVLGKFSPHVTSLMVNPQLDPSNGESSSLKSSCTDKRPDKRTLGESRAPSNTKGRQRQKKAQAKNKTETNLQIKTEIKTEDEESRDSNLVVDVGEPQKPKEVTPIEEKPRVKRKYTKRKRKEDASEQNPNSCPLPVDVKDIKKEPNSDFPIDINDIKVEPNTELPVDVNDIKVEPNTELPVDVNDIKVEPNTELPVDVKDIKVEPNNKEDKTQDVLPRPKRKYIKRKLVRKKYKRREPKQKPLVNNVVLPEKVNSEEIKSEIQQNDEEEMEMDLWIELGNDSVLTNEEVDSFFNSIEDPESLFRELGIIET